MRQRAAGTRPELPVDMEPARRVNVISGNKAANFDAGATKHIIVESGTTYNTPNIAELTGGVVSFTVISCVHSAVFPQASVARYVRVIVSGQDIPSDSSPTCSTSRPGSSTGQVSPR